MGLAMDLPYREGTHKGRDGKQFTGFVSIVKHLDWVRAMVKSHFDTKRVERKTNIAAFSNRASIHVTFIFLYAFMKYIF